MPKSVHIVCPHCSTTNRVPENKLKDRPICGRCRQWLFKGSPMDLNAASFEKHIGRNDIPTMVDFWAPWCGPCKMMGPVFAEAAALLEPQVRLGKINIDVEQAVASRFGVQSVPTVMLFKGGREIARQAGAMNLDSLVRWTQSYL